MSQYNAEHTLSERVELDAQLAQPLERVNYTAGMMLSLPAINAEQRYHRQRVNRLQYWFQGAGTLLGLAVKQSPAVKPEDLIDEAGDLEDQSVRLVVSPGIAIDGLGRELLCHEPYCVNLRDWLAAQKTTDSTFLQQSLTLDKTAIQFSVTIRYQASASGLQPVLARTINGGIDPVQPSRVKDALLLELLPLGKQLSFKAKEEQPSAEDTPPKTGAAFRRAGLKQETRNTTAPETWLSKTEQEHLATLESEQEKQLARLQLQLLYGPGDDVSALKLEGEYEDLAQVLLAVIEIPLRPPKDGQADISPILHPHAIRINNLIRPFITTPDQLRWLYLQENAS